MPVTPLDFPDFVITTDSEQRWQIYNAITTGVTTVGPLIGPLPAGTNSIGTVGLNAGTNNIGAVTSNNALIERVASFTRPADTTTYASGDLVANNTTAGSVVPLTFTAVTRSAGDSVRIERARINTSNALLTNASFRLHLGICSRECGYLYSFA
jgi:hypothetical protein